MTSSPGTRHNAAYLLLALLACLPAACAAEQPEACAAYLACFFPEGEKSPYVDVPDAGCGGESGSIELCQATLASGGEEAYALYGPKGECWRHGEGDLLYATCLGACRAALGAECEIARQGGPRESHCVVGAGDERRFEPPADTSLSQSCLELEGG